MHGGVRTPSTDGDHLTFGVTSRSRIAHGSSESESVAIIRTYHASVHGGVLSYDEVGASLCPERGGNSKGGRNGQIDIASHGTNIMN